MSMMGLLLGVWMFSATETACADGDALSSEKAWSWVEVWSVVSRS